MYLVGFGIPLMGFILARALWGKFLSRYPYFYIYLLYVLGQTTACFAVYYLNPKAYARVFWSTEFFAVILGCGVIWEIYSQALGPYVGVARLVKSLLFGVIGVVVVGVILRNSLSSNSTFPFEVTAHLDRSLRETQAIFLGLILALLLYYAIPLGRNMKGMIVGYTLYIAVLVCNLAFRTFLWREYQLAQFAYTASLGVWCVSLWSYSPNPLPESRSKLQLDYEALSEKTLQALARARRYLSRGIRL
jgi:hypothetical protein